MAKTRLNSKFLSPVHTASPVSATSYKNTMIWRWLQFVVAGEDECGVIIKALRKRHDMTNEWANRTQMRAFILKSRKNPVDSAAVERCLIHLWNMYAQYRDAEKHNSSFEPIKRGVTRNPWREEATPDDEAADIIAQDMGRFLSR